MAGYRYTVFAIMLCANIFVRSQCISQLSQSIWRSTIGRQFWVHLASPDGAARTTRSYRPMDVAGCQ
jgi:hypothetical protein